MSNKIYCMNCGASNLYQSSPPTFCGKCGQTVIKSSVASAPRKPVRPTVTRNEPEDLDEEEEEDNSIDINKIKQSLSINFIPQQKPTFWDAASPSAMSRADIIQERKIAPRPRTKKDVRAKMQQIREFQDKEVRRE